VVEIEGKFSGAQFLTRSLTVGLRARTRHETGTYERDYGKKEH